MLLWPRWALMQETLRHSHRQIGWDILPNAWERGYMPARCPRSELQQRSMS